MSNMYVRSAYGILSGHGYAQYVPLSPAYNDIINKVISPAFDEGKYPDAGKLNLSNEGAYPETLHPPGWSVLAAALTFITRIPVWFIMQGVTILFDLAALLLFFMLLREWKIKESMQRTAVLLYAVFPPLLFITANVRPEGFMSFFILANTLLFVRYYQTRQFRFLLYCGLVSGLMSYFRPDFLLFVPFLCLIFTTEFFRSISLRNFILYAGRPLFILLVTFATLLPWGIRNYREFGQWIFTSSGAGCTLVTGLGTYPNPWGFGPSDADRLDEAVKAGYRDAFDVKADPFFRQMFSEAVAEHPSAFLGILARRLIQPLAPPYSWGIQREEGASFTAFRSKGISLLSAWTLILRNYWTDMASAILMLLGNAGMIMLFIREKENKILRWVPVLAYAYAVFSHVFTHMAPYYVLPAVFAQLLGLVYLIAWLSKLRKTSVPKA
jgi:hypothetical protein